MILTVEAENVYTQSGLPSYTWEKYQRGFLGILNNAYNQSCNTGRKKLGSMNEIEESFVEARGSGSWQEFVRFYMREHDGMCRVTESIEAMAQNIQDRVASVGGSVSDDAARFWARKYIWYMLASTYRGFCSERMAIEIVASMLDLPYTTTGDESAGIDGTIGDTTVQVKPESYLGLDINDHDAQYTITYEHDDDDFVFIVPDELTPVS